MGAQYSHLVFSSGTEPSYSETIEGFMPIPHSENKLTIPAIYLEHKGSTNDELPITIIYSHDNSENLASILIWVKFLRDRLKVSSTIHPFILPCKVNVLAYEYSGYGLHAGKPSEKAIYEDIQSVFLYLTNVRNVPSNRIIL
jgi:hypothetical protein